jgi:DNA-binding transcriptional regulator YdaS (Cro superfamily)
MSIMTRHETAMDRYLAETGEKLSTFAARLGLSPSTMTRAVKGQRNVTVKLARLVEAGSGGRVKCADFIADCMAAAERLQ